VKIEVRKQKPNHKVLIIGDSHLKGSAFYTNQFLNTNYSVTSFIKPGASESELVSSQGKELNELGKEDVIVLSVGTNDMKNFNGTKGSGVVVKITKFMQTYNNTNIAIIGIPHRFDLNKESGINLEIQKINTKLKKMTKLFGHVSMIEMESNRDHHTKHGLHFNKAGKEKLARSAANLINQTVLSKKSENLAIILNWKEDVNIDTPIQRAAVKEPCATMDNPSLSEIVNEVRRKELCVTMDKSSPSAATNEKRKI
jgi:hypothetical protein